MQIGRGTPICGVRLINAWGVATSTPFGVRRKVGLNLVEQVATDNQECPDLLDKSARLPLIEASRHPVQSPRRVGKIRKARDFVAV